MSTLTEYTKFPQDKSEAGKHYWAVLFNSASQFPERPSREDKIDQHNFIKSTIKRFTCQECISNAFEFMRKHPADLDSKETLMKWLCSLKNNSNIHEGKEAIDCDEFVRNSINSVTGCKTCTIQPIKAPSVNISIPAVPLTPDIVNQESQGTPIKRVSRTENILPYDDDFESVLSWNKRYPSLKKSVNISNTEIETSPGEPHDLESRYPSLAGIDSDIDRLRPQEEELDGIIKPLDSVYAGPAAVFGIKPHEMNLAYTPEMLTNTVSLLTQIYLTNFGSLLTTLLSSVSLLGISVFAKNSLSHYDRLFIQNVTASLLFHNLNFINPRIKDEVMPDAQNFFEGLTSMNFDKIKEALLFGHKSEATVADKSAQELLDMLETKNGKIDMGKLDLRTKSGHGSGSGGALSTNEVEKMLNSKMSPSNTNYSVLGQSNDKFSYILDNNLL